MSQITDVKTHPALGLIESQSMATPQPLCGRMKVVVVFEEGYEWQWCPILKLHFHSTYKEKLWKSSKLGNKDYWRSF